ncbi:molybdopterin-dependent oxidoreductase Mo/Fe-S-binding subunit [candidate division KSB3 bacterium]|uniref:Molybdopterin-dependent oxidoreductase Mo/Fe-S-binding subunit n=1 Tax=candidate division KSB3 bacterium TaxID=2044937 RepID=A0A2G6KMJ1_9BACT|nr:MAG: molybdopterin-dependent oxidoreductase Mo/Fe-S-binding subunit [candidate division KSB3 bacterium]
MKIRIILNGTPKSVYTEAGENVQKLLQRIGIPSVRNSDDGYGFSGSDTILLDGKSVNAGLLVSAQVDGHDIKTVESLSDGMSINPVQSAMVDAGIVQSGYNAPAAALLISDLLDRIPNPSRTEIMDALSSLYNRATGYQQFFNAVELARQRRCDPAYTTKITDEFRDDLRDVGKARRKVDGAKLVMGKKAFVEDMVEPGSCILKMLRSPHAHAYIKHIDVSEAEAMPGVVTVLTYKNTPDVFYTPAGQGFPEPSPYDRRMFSQKVFHVGDRVAAVVAEEEEIALEALEKIQVEYEVLQPVFTIEDAEAEGAPIVHNAQLEYVVGAPDDLDEQNGTADDRDGKIVYQFPIGADPHKNIAASISDGIGDIDKGFEEADVILESTYHTSPVQCTPCEPHVVFTRMDGDRLVIHASTQVPWHLRRIVSTILGISENKVRVIKERVGGGYGSKQEILLEDVCAYATWKTGRPVSFRYTREEDLTSAVTRSPMKIRVKLGARKDGMLTAMYMDMKVNTGPYGNHCLTVPMNGCSKSLPLFVCDNIWFDVRALYSNIFPTGAYQGYGAPKGSYALQMAMAELAEKLDIDPLELIEKNRVSEGTVLEILRCLGEGREGVSALIKSCGLGPALEEGARMIEWGKKEESDDPDVKIGKGVVIVQQGSGLPGLDHSNADVKMLADGTFMVHSGGADLGTGLDTVNVKLAAEVLCTDMDNVSILSGDTDNTPFDTGAYASSGTFFSGNAVKKAAEDLKEQMLDAASAMLEEPADALEVVYPSRVKGKHGEVTFKEIAQNTQAGEGRGQLVGHASYTTDDAAFPYGAHFCQVAVNTRTGNVSVQKYYALQDCGTPINPELAEGQIYGGVLKSIGHTLFEDLIRDEYGACLTPDLQSYGAPMIGDIPDDFKVKLVYTDDPYGPYGGKSVSEISVNGAAPVIANAIHDAVGIWMRQWPFTPESVLRTLGKIE